MALLGRDKGHRQAGQRSRVFRLLLVRVVVAESAAHLLGPQRGVEARHDKARLAHVLEPRLSQVPCSRDCVQKFRMFTSPVVQSLPCHIKFGSNLAMALALPAKLNDGIAVFLPIVGWPSHISFLGLLSRHPSVDSLTRRLIQRFSRSSKQCGHECLVTVRADDAYLCPARPDQHRHDTLLHVAADQIGSRLISQLIVSHANRRATSLQ